MEGYILSNIKWKKNLANMQKRIKFLTTYSNIMKKIIKICIVCFLYIIVNLFGIGNEDMDTVLASKLKTNDNGQPEDVSSINKNLEMGYEIETFPYYYTENSKDLIDYYKKVLKGDVKQYYYLSSTKDDRVKRTINEDEAEYIYYGKLKKDYPNGKGVLFTKLDSELDIYYVCAIANFDKGYIDGYALCYELTGDRHDNLRYSLLQNYEGEYDKGKWSGEGILYTEYPSLEELADEDFAFYGDDEEEVTVEDNVMQFGDISIITNIPMISGLKVIYIGEFSKDEASGKGTSYSLKNQKTATYSGEFKHSKCVQGKQYNDDGSLLYEGEFKDQKYHGKGILYNPDGSVKYKGKFKNGDIK